MSRNWAYEVVCTDDAGWGRGESLWSPTYRCRESRIFASAAEARAVRDGLRNAGCWFTEDNDGNREPCEPRFEVCKISVYEACWETDIDLQDRLVEINGSPIRFERMPDAVARFLLAKFSGHAKQWRRESASLVGASSATHTAAFVAGIAESKVREISNLLESRRQT